MSQGLVSSLPSIEPSDTALIQATLQGDQNSFGNLIQKHQPAIFLMVHRHLRQREEAEDVVQKVFLQAYQHLGKFRGESKFYTWLYTIALNMVRNHVRQRNIRRTESLDVSRQTDDRPEPQWPDKSPPLEDVVHHRGELDRVRTAVDTLSDENRAIFTLHYFQHLSLKDVAGRVGRPLGTVKVYLHRARKAVLCHLESQKNPAGVTSTQSGVSKPI